MSEIRYAEHHPHPELRPYVACFWTATTGVMPRIETRKVLPDGCLDIVFDQTSMQVVGAMTHPASIPIGARERFIGVRFRPGAAGPFLRTDARLLTDRAEDLEALWGKDGRLLSSRLTGISDTSGQLRQLELGLRQRLRTSRAVNPTVTAAVQSILESHGRVTVENAARAAGTTTRSLTRKFAQDVGLSPKFLSRVARFQAVLAAIKTPEPPDWLSIAFDAGYYDQAHLNRDCRQLGGAAPTRLSLDF